MQINIVDKDGTGFTLDVESSDTILNVKSMIADLTDASIDHIRLRSKRYVLDESLMLGDYNVIDGAAINFFKL